MAQKTLRECVVVGELQGVDCEEALAEESVIHECIITHGSCDSRLFAQTLKSYTYVTEDWR